MNVIISQIVHCNQRIHALRPVGLDGYHNPSPILKSKIIELIGESFLNKSIVRGLMIVSRTPLRVSFCGGGTDLEAYYSTSQEGGCVTSVALNKYVYVTVNSRFDESVRFLIPDGNS